MNCRSRSANLNASVFNKISDICPAQCAGQTRNKIKWLVIEIGTSMQAHCVKHISFQGYEDSDLQLFFLIFNFFLQNGKLVKLQLNIQFHSEILKSTARSLICSCLTCGSKRPFY